MCSSDLFPSHDREGMSKSSIARRLGISRETVRKYALKPEGYVPVISRKPNENLVDEHLPYIAAMLEQHQLVEQQKL